MKILAVAACAAVLGTGVLAYTGQSDWAEETLSMAESSGIMPYVIRNSDVSMPVTRAEFAAVAVRLYDAMSEEPAEAADHNPFSDTADRDVLKAYAAGIVNGMTETTFEPESELTREQAAAMLARVYELAGEGEAEPSYTALFADDDEISDWARSAVYFMNENGIIAGVGGNRFAPGDTASREQAVVIAQRMLERFSPGSVVTPAPEETGVPEPTEEAPSETQAAEGDMLSRIPVPDFGEITESREDSYGATIVISGATLEDFEAYSAVVSGVFPQHINNLDNSFIIRSDGEYEINVNYSNGSITVTLEPADQ